MLEEKVPKRRDHALYYYTLYVEYLLAQSRILHPLPRVIHANLLFYCKEYIKRLRNAKNV